MTITALPPAPLVTDSPSDFNTKAFDLVESLDLFVSETNTTGENVAALESSAMGYAGSAEADAAAAVAAKDIAVTKAAEADTSATNAANYAAALKATSTTSTTIATGSKTFTTQASKQFASGQFVTAASDANNSNYMHGQVTSYAGTSLVCNMLDVGGTGTYADWTITVSGSQGAKGDKGDAGTGSGDMILATAQTVTETKAFVSGKLEVKGSSTGVTAIASANAGAVNYTATLPAASGTVAYLTDTVAKATVLETTRAIYGNNFDGSAPLAQVIAGAYGGTGVNNSTRTLTYAGNVTFTGAYAVSFAMPGAYTYTFPPATATLASTAGAETLTNKRVTARVGSTTSSATPSINTDSYDMYQITALAANITSVTVSGTPTAGQVLVVEITGTATRTIAWGTSFEASTVALPTTTVGTAKLTVAFIWNTVTSKWRCVGAV